jgi:hypothetical protein
MVPGTEVENLKVHGTTPRRTPEGRVQLESSAGLAAKLSKGLNGLGKSDADRRDTQKLPARE